MSQQPPIADRRVKDFIAQIGSTHVSPGAGSAGAVALALAAACAAKAVSITLKHQPEVPKLNDALAAFMRIAEVALVHADHDSDAFAGFVRTKSAAAGARLICEAENIAHLIGALAEELGSVEPLIDDSMRGDLVAAEALLGAARSIQQRNEAEALRAR